MLTAHCGIRVMNFMKVLCFLSFLFYHTVILCQSNHLSVRTLESGILPANESAVVTSDFTKMEAADPNGNALGTGPVSSDIIMHKPGKGIRGKSLIARFETIDISIVQKFAPILNFHPNEGLQCCYPSSAEEAYPRAKSGKTGKVKAPKTFDDNAPCYFEALYTENGFRIKYWFWYNYNDYPTGPNLWGCHPGDWEYLEIYFENEQPYLYHFSNHKGVRARGVSDVTIVDNHVEVWVGSGSHANYESAMPLRKSSVLGFSDKVATGGAIWNTANNLTDIRNTNFCQENYVGDWGDGKKIFGPLNRMNK
jgi:hypothetical protein